MDASCSVPTLLPAICRDCYAGVVCDYVGLQWACGACPIGLQVCWLLATAAGRVAASTGRTDAPIAHAQGNGVLCTPAQSAQAAFQVDFVSVSDAELVACIVYAGRARSNRRASGSANDAVVHAGRTYGSRCPTRGSSPSGAWRSSASITAAPG
jgi:hypothetical protein